MKVLGDALKKERELRELSLEEIARTVHIRLTFLKALEEEDFNAIPGRSYVRHYIKSYLAAVGADEDAFFNTYQEYLNEKLSGCGRRSEPVFEQMHYTKFKKKNFLLYFFLTVILFAALLSAYLTLPGIKDLIQKTLHIGKSPVSQNQIVPPQPEKPKPVVVLPISIKLSFKQPCWTQIFKGNEKVLERICQPQETIDLDGSQLTLMLGNPAGVELKVNGREIAYLKKLSAPEKLVLNPQNLEELFKR